MTLPPDYPEYVENKERILKKANKAFIAFSEATKTGDLQGRVDAYQRYVSIFYTTYDKETRKSLFTDAPEEMRQELLSNNPTLEMDFNPENYKKNQLIELFTKITHGVIRNSLIYYLTIPSPPTTALETKQPDVEPTNKSTASVHPSAHQNDTTLAKKWNLSDVIEVAADTGPNYNAPSFKQTPPSANKIKK